MKRIMKIKYIFPFFSALVILFFQAQYAYAYEVDRSNVYNLNEIGVTICLPYDFDVFTRNMPNNDPLLSVYGLTSDQINESLIPQNIYLDALSPDGTKEIVVTMMGSTIPNFNIKKDNYALSCVKGERIH